MGQKVATIITIWCPFEVALSLVSTPTVTNITSITVIIKVVNGIIIVFLPRRRFVLVGFDRKMAKGSCEKTSKATNNRTACGAAASATAALF